MADTRSSCKNTQKMTVVTLAGKVIRLPTLGTHKYCFSRDRMGSDCGLFVKTLSSLKTWNPVHQGFLVQDPSSFYSTGSHCLPPKLQGSSAGMLGSSTRLVSISVRLCLLDFIQKPEMLCFQLTRAQLSLSWLSRNPTFPLQFRSFPILLPPSLGSGKAS